jgi:hypothetical protein
VRPQNHKSTMGDHENYTQEPVRNSDIPKGAGINDGFV